MCEKRGMEGQEVAEEGKWMVGRIRSRQLSRWIGG